VRELLRALSGAEDALVVNNGAAALLLALTALAAGRGVLVSRGELVEIGGSFRVPEIISACGARLVEVGTTNRTRAADFARAVNDEVSVLLAVHPSNFRVSGFVERPSPAELVAVSASRRLHAVYDVGSGALTTDGEEPGVRDMIGAGFDLVTFSGDKLLGGPQAGIVVGEAALVERLRAHPLYRALRVDKVTLAGLEATLRGWRDGAPPPVARFRALDRGALRVRAEGVREALRARLGQVGDVELTLVEVEGAVGGGSLPGAVLPGVAVAVRCSGLDKLSAALRRGDPPVIARVADERLLLDLRAVRAEDEPTLVDAVAAAVLARAP
jgi:L-seryl-tRNA(Ser) seleniumtransferase